MVGVRLLKNRRLWHRLSRMIHGSRRFAYPLGSTGMLGVMFWGILVVFLVGCRQKPPYEGRSVSELERMLQSSDPLEQSQGAYGLSLLGPEARPAVSALTDALRSPTSIVRQHAALALAKIGPDASPAVPALIDVLRDTEWAVRRQAAMALASIGAAAERALPALKQLEKDPDRLVRQAAQEAVKKIRG